MKKIALSFALVASLVTVASAETRKAAPAPQNPTLGEIQKTFGFVPDFVKGVPEALLPAFWGGITGLEMNPATKLDGKTKELIGLAVAAQVPCEYCVYFHTEAAKLNGATDEEIKEAVAMASLTRMGSTILNGNQTDKAQFKKDIQRIVDGAKAHAKK
ncbi:MAG TPA: carboxymuconolactone decarboxylase family protein [Kofleriaceae bacterium]|nr:carboxymuconolactone decarboxylase family protein [Kofleriaceae bacterium]